MIIVIEIELTATVGAAVLGLIIAKCVLSSTSTSWKYSYNIRWNHFPFHLRVVSTLQQHINTALQGTTAVLIPSLKCFIKCLTNCARCDWQVRVHYSYIKHAAYVTRVLYRVLHNSPSYSRILIGSLLWCIRGQIHDWHHHHKVFLSAF